MLNRMFAAAVHGVHAVSITIEIDVYGGDFGYTLVGLPDKSVQESRERIAVAFKNNGFQWPRQRVSINMAPADVRKEGSSYDLPLALGILRSSGQVRWALDERWLVMGELALDGSLKPVKGILPMAILAKEMGFSGMIIPSENAAEAALVEGLSIRHATNLKSIVGLVEDTEAEPLAIPSPTEMEETTFPEFSDFSEVRGQESIKRALEIAAAGGHNVLLIGPPGAGKSMLSKRLPSILPPMSMEESLESTKIHSVSGKLAGKVSQLITQRPFRSPHHTVSAIGLIGGGSVPQPGEISLAHHGVLFLDELPEYPRTVLEVLRQPLEDRKVCITRARMSLEYPANFMLVGSMNPCPCGYFNHPTKRCSCSPETVRKYLNRISGPLLDRIDLHVEVTPVSFDELTAPPQATSEPSATIRARVVRARQVQLARLRHSGVFANAQMSSSQTKTHCRLDAPSIALLKTAMEKLGLSARAYDRILKVARTVADLDQSESIRVIHLAEAIQFRTLDREDWGLR